MWFPEGIWYIILYDFVGIHKYYRTPSIKKSMYRNEFYTHINTTCFDKIISKFKAAEGTPVSIIMLRVLQAMIKWNPWIQMSRQHCPIWDQMAPMLAERCENMIHTFQDVCQCETCEICTMQRMLYRVSREFFKVYVCNIRIMDQAHEREST